MDVWCWCENVKQPNKKNAIILFVSDTAFPNMLIRSCQQNIWTYFWRDSWLPNWFANFGYHIWEIQKIVPPNCRTRVFRTYSPPGPRFSTLNNMIWYGMRFSSQQTSLVRHQNSFFVVCIKACPLPLLQNTEHAKLQKNTEFAKL